MRRLLAASAALLLPLAVAGCGGDDDTGETATTPPAATAVGEAAASFNDADVTFAQGMIPHHQQAVEMAEIALDPAVEAGPDVVDLATRVQAAQDPEIELMTGWLNAWGQPLEASGEMDMSDGSHDTGSMGGMMSDEEMDALRAARGGDLDRLWMEMMIAHHEGAIEMAETEQDEGTNPDAIALAGQIITAQQAEIDEMNELLAAQ
jgi:uncharacterized protein (DUF305 family)